MVCAGSGSLYCDVDCPVATRVYSPVEERAPVVRVQPQGLLERLPGLVSPAELLQRVREFIAQASPQSSLPPVIARRTGKTVHVTDVREHPEIVGGNLIPRAVTTPSPARVLKAAAWESPRGAGMIRLPSCFCLPVGNG